MEFRRVLFRSILLFVIPLLVLPLGGFILLRRPSEEARDERIIRKQTDEPSRGLAIVVFDYAGCAVAPCSALDATA